jgi:hypothetical protein
MMMPNEIRVATKGGTTEISYTKTSSKSMNKTGISKCPSMFGSYK